MMTADIFKVIRGVLVAVSIVVMAGIIVVTRVSNPALTETQLFIAFWPRWGLVVVLALLAAWELRRP